MAVKMPRWRWMLHPIWAIEHTWRWRLVPIGNVHMKCRDCGQCKWCAEPTPQCKDRKRKGVQPD